MSSAVMALTAACVVAGQALVLAGPASADANGTAAVQTQRMKGPNLNSGQEGVYNAGDRLTLVCHTRGQAVQGHFSFNIPGGWDDLWYQTSDGHYVADVDIETGTLNPLGPACGDPGPAPVVQAEPAPAPNPTERVQGVIACINGAKPVGIWVQAQSSTSGWAELLGYPLEAAGAWKMNYAFNLDRGGAYQVHVGCGGRPEKWDNNLKSDYVTGSHDFLCNDVNPIAEQIFNSLVRGQLFGRLFGRQVQLGQGVPRNHCNVV